MAYPLLLAAAEKVDEFVKLFLIMANAQQISIFHSENFKRQQDFPFFFVKFHLLSSLLSIIICYWIRNVELSHQHLKKIQHLIGLHIPTDYL